MNVDEDFYLFIFITFTRKIKEQNTCIRNSCPSLLVLNGGKCLMTFVSKFNNPISPLSSTVLCLLSKYSLVTTEFASERANASMSNKQPCGSSILSEKPKILFL